MLAHLRNDRDIGAHGHPLSRSTDVQADPARPGGWHYEANLPTVDFAALALEQAQAARYKTNPDEPRNAHLWTVREVLDD